MNRKTQQFESLFRQATPLFLLGMLLVVVFEPWLPYRDWLYTNFGEQIVVRVVLVFTVGYVLLLWGETLRLHGILSGVLEAFRAFDRDRQGEGASSSAKGARNPKARLEAARLLIAAMRSGDASIRETSHHNLVRLVGQDLGADPDRWQRWLDEQPGA